MADDGNCATQGNLDGQAMSDALMNHETGPSVADLANAELTGTAVSGDPNGHDEFANLDPRPKPRQTPRSQPKPTQVRPQHHAQAVAHTEPNAVVYDATTIDHPTTSTMTAGAPRRPVAKPPRIKAAFHVAPPLPPDGPTVKEHFQQKQLAQRQHQHQELMRHLKDEDDMKKRMANAHVSQQALSEGAPGQSAHHYVVTEHVTPGMTDVGGHVHYENSGDNMHSANYLTYPSGVGAHQNFVPANNPHAPVDGAYLSHATPQPGMTMVSPQENNRGPNAGPITHRYIVTSSSHPQQFSGHAPVHVHADAPPAPRQMVAPPILRQPKVTGSKPKTTKVKIEKDPLLSTIDRVASGDVPLSASMSKRIMNDNHDLFSDLEPADFEMPIPAKPPPKRVRAAGGQAKARAANAKAAKSASANQQQQNGDPMGMQAAKWQSPSQQANYGFMPIEPVMQEYNDHLAYHMAYDTQHSQHSAAYMENAAREQAVMKTTAGQAAARSQRPSMAQKPPHPNAVPSTPSSKLLPANLRASPATDMRQSPVTAQQRHPPTSRATPAAHPGSSSSIVMASSSAGHPAPPISSYRVPAGGGRAQLVVRQRDAEFKKYSEKLYHLKRTVRALVYKNAGLSDEVGRLQERIHVVTEERKTLAKRLQHHERNRMRRIQTQQRKAAAAAMRGSDGASASAVLNGHPGPNRIGRPRKIQQQQSRSTAESEQGLSQNGAENGDFDSSAGSFPGNTRMTPLMVHTSSDNVLGLPSDMMSSPGYTPTSNMSPATRSARMSPSPVSTRANSQASQLHSDMPSLHLRESTSAERISPANPQVHLRRSSLSQTSSTTPNSLRSPNASNGDSPALTPVRTRQSARQQERAERAQTDQPQSNVQTITPPQTRRPSVSPRSVSANNNLQTTASNPLEASVSPRTRSASRSANRASDLTPSKSTDVTPTRRNSRASKGSTDTSTVSPSVDE